MHDHTPFAALVDIRAAPQVTGGLSQRVTLSLASIDVIGGESSSGGGVGTEGGEASHVLRPTFSSPFDLSTTTNETPSSSMSVTCCT